MRNLFVWILRLQAWLSPFVLAYYGYIVAGADAGGVGGVLGFMIGCIFWLVSSGLADLAETIWDNQKELAELKKLVVRISMK